VRSRRWRVGWLGGRPRMGRMRWCRYRPMFMSCRCSVLGFDGHRDDIPPGERRSAHDTSRFRWLAHNLLGPGTNRGSCGRVLGLVGSRRLWLRRTYPEFHDPLTHLSHRALPFTPFSIPAAFGSLGTHFVFVGISLHQPPPQSNKNACRFAQPHHGGRGQHAQAQETCADPQ